MPIRPRPMRHTSHGANVATTAPHGLAFPWTTSPKTARSSAPCCSRTRSSCSVRSAARSDFTRYHVGGNVSAGLRGRLSEDITSHLVVGADEAYQDGAILFYGLANGERATDLRDNKREGANNLGVYLHDELHIGESVALTLGARYDDITYHAESFINPKINGVKRFKGVTPKIG